MPSVASAALFALAACATTSATEANPTARNAKVLSLPLRRGTVGSSSSSIERTKRDEVSVAAPERSYDKEAFLVDVEIGTPPQRIQLAVDVSTPQTWAIYDCGDLYFSQDRCREYGTYNDSRSSSSTHIFGGGVEWEADDGSSADLLQRADDVTILGGAGDTTLKNITFGLYDYPKTHQYGILGLGLGKGFNDRGSSVVDSLVEQGAIAARAFGLSLGSAGDNTTASASSTTPSLVFGGVDIKKFAGPLTRVPLVDGPESTFGYNQTQYWITVDAAYTTDANGTRTPTEEHPSFRALPHSADVVSWLPRDLVRPIAAAFGVPDAAISDPDGEESDDYLRATGGRPWYVVSCEYMRDRSLLGQAALTLRFGGGGGDNADDGEGEGEGEGLRVSIPYADLLARGDIMDEGSDDCFITTQPRNVTDDGELFWLGNGLMRALYALYDQDGRAVWLAPAHDCGSELLALAGGDGGGDEIAGLKGQCYAGAEANDGSGGGDGQQGSSGSREQLRVSTLGLVVALCMCFCMGL